MSQANNPFHKHFQKRMETKFKRKTEKRIKERKKWYKIIFHFLCRVDFVTSTLRYLLVFLSLCILTLWFLKISRNIFIFFRSLLSEIYLFYSDFVVMVIRDFLMGFRKNFTEAAAHILTKEKYICLLEKFNL